MGSNLNVTSSMPQHHIPSSSGQSLVWLVTGCSSGLGRHLVCAILARGDRVIATARRLSDLEYVNNEEGGKDRAHCIRLDVTAPPDELDVQVNRAIEHFGHIDVLVNNAGFVVSGVWEELSDKETRRQFDTNFFGALNVTRCVLPHMRAANSGVILFIGSISGCHGVGSGGPYSASKFALEGAAECLAKETMHLGIRTHVMVLGQFRTQILDDARKEGNLSPTGLPEYDAIKAEMAERHEQTHGKQPGDPSLAAERIVDIARMENLSVDEKARLPFRVPLGSDALEVMRTKSSQILHSLEGYERFAQSTDFTKFKAIPSYFR